MAEQETFTKISTDLDKLTNFDQAPSINLLSVSIVIPSYNRCDRLEKMILHIAQQEYPSNLVELVICLDGCTDDSSRMLHNLQTNYPIALVVLEQPQSGPAAARNRAIRAAKNDLIVFLDDDVFPVPELLQHHVKHHLTNSNLVVIAPMQPPIDFERPFWVKWEEEMLEKQYRAMLKGEFEPTSRQFYTGNTSIRREELLKLGDLFDENFKRAEDIELAHRLADKGFEFYFEPAAIGYHYANRTYQSWETSRYQYGKYDLIMARDKNQRWIFEINEQEAKERSFITKLLFKFAVNKPWYNLTRKGLFQLAKLLYNLKLEKISYKVLSSLANMLYGQGWQDELARKK